MQKSQEITIFRVRKSADNIKSQKGAYFLLSNAIKKAIKTKCNIYGNNKSCIWSYEKYLTEVNKNEQSL